MRSDIKKQHEYVDEVKVSVSVGICAYNEEKNIGELLKSIQKQVLTAFNIMQIVVVSSACHDKTDEIVESYRLIDPRIELIRQQKREGKASAVNLFLQAAKGDICILISADTILPSSSGEYLCYPFLDQNIGMTGGHPVPVNDPSKFMGFVSHYIWSLAHQLSLIEPKLGECIAFRRVIDKIPSNTAVDEAAIEAQIREKGYNLAYVPEAIVYNRGPETIADFIKRRRNLYTGHLNLKKTTGYKVSSMSMFKLLKIVFRSVKFNWRSVFWTPLAMVLELYARVLGSYDFYIKKKNQYIWDLASSTKSAIITNE